MEHASDFELISGCIRKSQAHWDAFVERFSRVIFWSIRKTFQKTPFAGREDLVWDVFQEMFKRLLEREELTRLRDLKSAPKFLIVMACRLAMDKAKMTERHEKRHATRVGGAEAEDEGSAAQEPFFEALSPDPASETLTREQEMLVAEALEGLPPRERACLEFYYLEGKTHREIAGILGVTENAVSGVISRAREKLKDFFTQKGLGN